MKMLSYCPMGPMRNAIRAVPSHPTPWDISHRNPIPMDKPANCATLAAVLFTILTQNLRLCSFAEAGIVLKL